MIDQSGSIKHIFNLYPSTSPRYLYLLLVCASGHHTHREKTLLIGSCDPDFLYKVIALILSSVALLRESSHVHWRQW